MKITENEHEIILIDTPILYWIVGTIMAVLGVTFVAGLAVFVYVKSLLFAIFNSNDVLNSIFLLVFGLLATTFFVGLILSMILMPKITIKVNAAKNNVEVSRIGLLKKQIDKYYFLQISRFDIITDQKTNYSQLFLILANEAKIPLEIGKHEKNEAAKIAEKLNSILLQ